MAQSPDVLQLRSDSVEASIEIARRLGAAMQRGDVIALCGPLGAGKTHFVKGLAAGVGVADSRQVNSPTFVIVQEYVGRERLFHVDAYRLGSADDLFAIGFEEYPGRGVVAVEWADRVPGALPEDCVVVTIEPVGPTEREIFFEASGDRSRRLVEALRTE